MVALDPDHGATAVALWGHHSPDESFGDPITDTTKVPILFPQDVTPSYQTKRGRNEDLCDNSGDFRDFA